MDPDRRRHQRDAVTDGPVGHERDGRKQRHGQVGRLRLDREPHGRGAEQPAREVPRREPMNNRTIAGGVLAAVLVLAVWWMFVFSPVRSDASKVDTEIESAQADTKSLEAENAELKTSKPVRPNCKPTSTAQRGRAGHARARVVHRRRERTGCRDGRDLGVGLADAARGLPVLRRPCSCRWSSRAGTSKSSTTSTASRTCRGSSSSTRCP